MLPSGVFVRADLDELVSSLPGRLAARGSSRLNVAGEPDTRAPKDQAALEVSSWSEEWCLIEITGPEELTALIVDCVVNHEPLSEVLPCRFQSRTGDFSYSLYREGRLMESFESRGPSIETVNFTSDLRRVQLQTLLRASDFMIRSMSHFGIDPGQRLADEVMKVRFHVSLPGKRSFWQSLLGAVSPR
ncbi:MAG: hypothetical protein JSV70_07455 [bacterium]|nr:MAG: hypothetical protein JSV70_07455 [bacterium]